MRKRGRVFYPVVMMLAGLCLIGCNTKENAQEEIELLAPAEAVVDIETVMYRDLYTLVTKNAEFAPYTKELTFNAGGRISKLYVEIGSVVKEGDLIAEQEEEGVRDKANAALNEFLSEKKVYLDTVKAAKKKLASAIGKEERERQELVIAQAEELWEMQEPILWEAWEKARNRLGSSRIVAPYDGVVLACLKEGKTVAAGQPVLAIAATECPYITVNSYLSPSEYASYERVYAIINGKETDITYVEELMEEEGTLTYFSAEDYNGAALGDFILICMVKNYHPHVLSIPAGAVYQDSNGSYVYLMEDDVRVRRDVITGYTDNVYVEIAEGLQEGDRVYVKN